MMPVRMRMQIRLSGEILDRMVIHSRKSGIEELIVRRRRRRVVEARMHERAYGGVGSSGCGGDALFGCCEKEALKNLLRTK
jgi:hypothetical protein